MNPPPLPPSVTKKSSFPQHAATISLLVSVLGVIIVVVMATFHDPQKSPTTIIITDAIFGLLICVGFLFGILALVGMPQYGAKAILVKSITGLVINGILSLILIGNLALGYQRSLQSRTAALDKVKTAEADIRSGYRKPFNPNAALTNEDAGKLDRLSTALKDASQNLTGDDALISQAMSAHVDRIHAALTNYQSAALALRAAEVLNHFDPTNKAQFATRREVVNHFLSCNTALTQVITNSENNIRADLTKSHVSAAHIQSVLDGYHTTAAPISAINVRIRQCDDHMGAALLDALNLLESEWYKWNIDPKTGHLRFDDKQDLTAYNKALQEMHDAGEDQLKLEKQLVRAQQTMPAQ